MTGSTHGADLVLVPIPKNINDGIRPRITFEIELTITEMPPKFSRNAGHEHNKYAER